MSNSIKVSDEPFDDATIARLAGIARVQNDPAAIGRLKNELVPLGQEFRRIISSTPSELKRSPSSDTLTQRLEWVDTQVLNPLLKLVPALHLDSRHMLSLWPQEVAPELMPNLDEVTKHLEHLQHLARHIALMLAVYRKLNLPHGLLIRTKIVAAAAAALDRALPDLKPSRGTYNKESKGFNGTYPDLIRGIYKAITGEDEQLDGLIKEQVVERRNPMPPETDPLYSSYNSMLRGLMELPHEDDTSV